MTLLDFIDKHPDFAWTICIALLFTICSVVKSVCGNRE